MSIQTHGNTYKLGDTVYFTEHFHKGNVELNGTITSFGQSPNGSILYANVLVAMSNYFGAFHKPLYTLRPSNDNPN